MANKNIFVNRPIMAISLNLLFIIIGIIAYNNLSLRHRPNEQKYSVTINTMYKGANSNVVEKTITKPFEEVISGIDGIKKIYSKSSDDSSFIEVEFENYVNFPNVYSQLRDKILSQAAFLPKEVNKPSIHERSQNNFSVIFLNLRDNTRNLSSISDYVIRNLQEPISMLKGVAEVNIFNVHKYFLEVVLSPSDLFKHDISVSQILAVLRNEKIYASAGELQTSVGKKTIVLTAPLKSEKDIENLPIISKRNEVIKLGRLAKVKVSTLDKSFNMQVDGEQMVGLSITAKPQANPIDVSNEVQKYVKEIQPRLPGTMQLEVLYDATEVFRASIQEVLSSLLESVILVGVIVTLSLASLRASFMPIITVPFCLCGTFIFMWMFNFSINPITLLAMVLAVGLVVDDAIVVVENIYKHMNNGCSIKTAASKSMGEITFAIIVMTVTLAAVYLPLALQKDSSAVLLREFAWTLSASVIISGVVALTLIPSLCAQLLKPHNDNVIDKIWIKMQDNYKKMLKKTIKNPVLVCVIAFFTAVIGVGIFKQLPSELMPKEDDSFVRGYVSYSNKVGDDLKQKWKAEVEEILQENVPERRKILMFSNENKIWWNMILLPSKDRNAHKDEIVERVKGKLSSLVGPIFGVNSGASGGLEDDSIKIIVKTQNSENYLLELMDKLKPALIESEIFSEVNIVDDSKVSRINIEMDREIANNLGVDINEIELTLTTLLSGKKVGYYTFDGYDYDIIARGDLDLRSNLNKLNQVFIKSKTNASIPLGSLVNIKEELYPRNLKRYNKSRGAVIKVTLASGVIVSDAIQKVKDLMKEHLSENDNYQLKGSAEKYQEAQKAILITFLLSIVFIYLMLAALFESIVDPLVVMLTVPLSITGALIAVYFTGGSNNVFMQIGIITLIGLITKHGILIVDFANKLFIKGKSAEQAVLQAATSRLRPILMTTAAIIFGAVSLLFSVGMGAVARKSIGWVVIGGMCSGTILSLFFIPLVCLFSLKKFKRRAA